MAERKHRTKMELAFGPSSFFPKGTSHPSSFAGFFKTKFRSEIMFMKEYFGILEHETSTN